MLEVCHDLEVANAAEQKWIDHFKTRDPAFGFNLTPGGAHTPHPIKNPWDRPEFRDIISKRSRDMWQDPEFRARNLPALQAMSADPEMRKRWSESTSRQFSSPESRQKMSETVKALHQIPEIAEKFRSGFRKTDAERAAKTHCKHDHEFTPENTRTDERGWRYCKRCAADRVAKKARGERTHCAKGHEFVKGSFRFSRSGERICLLCAATHCKRGHELTPETTYLNGGGSRVCKVCERMRGRESDARRRAKRRASFTPKS